MQRYIYGNLHGAAYQTVSSDKGQFFTSNGKALEKLMYYDTASQHGNLEPGAHRCFWLLTTDLGAFGMPNYLFLQESGLDIFRSATVVQGYRSDLADGDLYGPRFLELLDTAFVSNKKALETAENEKLQRVEVDTLPRENIQQAAIGQELLEGILLTLMQGKRVIVQIPSTGAEAMQESRQYLKAIYQRLPYEMRRSNGCLTGATAPMLEISPAFTIVLMDGDTNITGITSDVFQTVFDSTGKEVRLFPRNKVGAQHTFDPLIQYLASEKPETLDPFFAYCRETLENAKENSPKISDYFDLLAVYSMGQKRLSGEEIRDWAVRLRRSSLREFFYPKIAAAIPTENMVNYLKTAAPGYDDLAQLRIIKPEDEIVQQDQDASLTLSMMLYLPGYDLDAVRKGMAEHFVEKAREQYTCLLEQEPTADTVKALKAIPLPEETEAPVSWLDKLRNDVEKALRGLIAKVEKTYDDQRFLQKTSGETRIWQWFLERRESGDSVSGTGVVPPVQGINARVEAADCVQSCGNAQRFGRWGDAGRICGAFPGK